MCDEEAPAKRRLRSDLEKHDRPTDNIVYAAKEDVPRSAEAGRLHPLVPRESERWKKLYGHGRMAVEAFNSVANGQHRLDDLRSRGIVRARRHTGLLVIAMLAASAIVALRVSSARRKRAKACPWEVRKRVRTPTGVLNVPALGSR